VTAGAGVVEERSIDDTTSEDCDRLLAWEIIAGDASEGSLGLFADRYGFANVELRRLMAVLADPSPDGFFELTADFLWLGRFS